MTAILILLHDKDANSEGNPSGSCRISLVGGRILEDFNVMLHNFSDREQTLIAFHIVLPMSPLWTSS